MSDALPHSAEAELSVVGQLLANPKVAPEVIGLLEVDHFYLTGTKLIYEQIVESFFADDPIDPLVIGEAAAKPLAKVRNCDETEAKQWVQHLAKGQRQLAARQARHHAEIVKKHSDYRALLELSAQIKRTVDEEQLTPDEIAGDSAQQAMKIATDSILTNEIIQFGDLGRRFIKNLRHAIAARDQGIELGAYFNLDFIDSYTRGLQPTELMVAGGEPGVGKSAVWWKAALNFAERQMGKPEDQRVGTLILSLEMGEQPSSVRIAQTISGLDGGSMREGLIADSHMQKIVREWSKRQDIPLYVNHTSTLKASQMRALITEGIRKHNIGLVVIDHFRYFRMDQRFDTVLQEEEEKVQFLKEGLAKDLNIAVICLAHTTKAIESQDKRPRLSHLRGSGQIGAHADFVNFVFRPYNYASQKAKDEGKVMRTDAELIWAKNRHGMEGTAEFYADFSTMQIDDPITA